MSEHPTVQIRPGHPVELPDWSVDRRLPEPARYLAEAYERLLIQAERADALRPGVIETPERAAKAWRELTGGYSIDLDGVFSAVFEAEDYDEMVVVRDIPMFSLCEHHLLPFHGYAHIAYIPDAHVLGLSKFARVVEAFARRLQLQERLTVQVADAIERYLDPVGVMVVVEAEHLCMTMRGAQVPGARTVTSAVKGALKDKPEARAEALRLLQPKGRTT